MFRSLMLLLLALAPIACVPALVPVAAAAPRSDDFVLIVDIDSNNGSVKRTLVLQQELPRDTASWAAERSAAAASLAAWVSWLQTNDSPAYAWVTGLTTAQQNGLRDALLKGQ